MTTEVVSFRPEDGVEQAMATLVERGIGGGPVVDEEGRLVGVISDDDLIVQGARLHVPTVFTLLSEVAMWPPSVRHFERELRKAMAATVGEVMSRHVVTCSPDDTVEDVATTLHDRGLRRLPVVEDGRVVGIVARGDVLRALAGVPRPGRGGGRAAGEGDRGGGAEHGASGRRAEGGAGARGVER
jgi:CBS domain-containing protein